MNSLRPYQLTVLGTSRCTATCGHCSMNSSPRRREQLSFEQIRSAIDDLHAKAPLGVVIFAGGEPTLLGETLLDAIAHADSLGITTRVVTNAFWAQTPEKAAAKITDLRQAGLAELNISTDDHHLPFIPFDNVIRAWQASKRRGFSSVVIANCAGPKSVITPEYIMAKLGETLPMRFDDAGKSSALPPAAEDGTVYMMSNSYLQRLGRANEHVDTSELVIPESEEALAGGCPWAVRSAALSPRNHLVACCGMEAEGNKVLDFGDAGHANVNELLAAANNSVIVNAIALLGPLFLQRFIRERAPHVSFRSRYATVCEICEDIVSRDETIAVLTEHLHALAPQVMCARQVLDQASINNRETQG